MGRDLTLSRSVKQELSTLRPADEELARAELAGILACRARAHPVTGTMFVTAEPYLVRRLIWLSRLAEKALPACNVTFARRTPRRNLTVLVSQEADLSAALDFSRRHVRRAFLRGTFVGRGSMSNSSSGPHLEIVFASRKQAETACSLARAEGLSPGVAERRGEWVVYLKAGDEIAEFLKMLGASRGVMDYEDQRVRRSLRGTVNRLVNMDGANLSRSVEASLRQIEHIRVVEERIGLSSLPTALREIARARLEHPELTLEELGSTLKRPISKSAVNHRLRRLSKIARGLLGKRHPLQVRRSYPEQEPGDSS